MQSRAVAFALAERPRYRERPAPVVFPEEAEVPETLLHLELRILLYQLLVDYLGEEATVGSDQFVYYAADDPHQFLAPDAFVRMGPRQKEIRSWKTWERGAPEVAVEIVSRSDALEISWEEKLARYRRLGVGELVRFDPEAALGERLRIWDRLEENLAERRVTDERAPSLVLGLVWLVAPAEGHQSALRIAEDPEGQRLVPTRAEARQAEVRAREAEVRAREAEVRSREAEARARRAAEARIAELEAELKRYQS